MHFRIEKTTRIQPDFNKRFAWFWCTQGALILVVFGYKTFGTAFANVSEEYQWILGLLSPFAKDITVKILSHLVYKSAGPHAQGRRSMKFPLGHYITTKHAVFLAVIVGNVSTPLTSYCIMATDFSKTVYTGLKIIRNKNKGKDVKGKYSVNDDFSLNWRLISYTFIYIFKRRYHVSCLSREKKCNGAYLHYTHLDGLLWTKCKNSWKRSIIDLATRSSNWDINIFVFNVSRVLAFDLLSLVINGILLKYYCDINVFEVLRNLQKEFWVLFAIAEVFLLMEVPIQKRKSLEKAFILLNQFSKGVWSVNYWWWWWCKSRIWLDLWKVCLELYWFALDVFT